MYDVHLAYKILDKDDKLLNVPLLVNNYKILQLLCQFR